MLSVITESPDIVSDACSVVNTCRYFLFSKNMTFQHQKRVATRERNRCL